MQRWEQEPGPTGLGRREQEPGPAELDRREKAAVRRTFSGVGLACAVFFVTTTLSQLAAAFLLEWLHLEGNLWMFLCMISMYPIAFPLCILMMRRVPKGPPLPRFPMSPLRFGGIFIICVGGMFVGNIIGQMMMLVVSIVTRQPMINDVGLLLEQMDVWSVLVLTVICAPVVEETIFRKLLIDRLAPWGQLTAVLVSGGMFGLAHGNFYQFFYAFILGLIFGYVYLRTGRVRYTIALHMLINIIGSIVPMAILNLSESHVLLSSMLLAGDYLILTGCVLCGLILLIVCRRDIWFEKSRLRISAGQFLKAGFINVGMILFLIYCAVSFLLA